MSWAVALGACVAGAGLAADGSGRIRRWLHVFQLEHYARGRLLRWWAARRDLLHLPELAVAVAALAAAYALLAGGVPGGAGIALAVVGLAGGVSAGVEWRRPEKKPFVFTARAKRLFTACAVLAVAIAAAGAAVSLTVAGVTDVAVTSLVAGGVTLVALTPLVIVAASTALGPTERRINAGFVTAARRTLADVGPLTVGITGSYGKTTTKFCVGALLQTAGETLVTPESYNSFLGVTRTINERLRPGHRFFVVEMGAYRKGDIAELCDLVAPRIGILTAIGPMHLERFGSLEAIRDAKAELLWGLPADGHFITSAEDPLCRELARTATPAVTLFGIDTPDADVWASDVAIAPTRTTFALHVGERVLPVESALLGRHNVRNLLAAAACGVVLGMDDAALVRGLEAVTPPPHRLAPIVNAAAGVTVLDDAYNSNPEGAREALSVLATHTGGRRLLVTPGMVELGDRHETANSEFGRLAAGVCDFVFLVGEEQTRPVRRGLIEGGAASDRILVTDSVDHATAELRKVLRPGDAVLFENDLPDTYANGHGWS